MAKRLTVKVCGIKYPENRETLESLPIDILGFIFYPRSPRYVGNAAPEEISRLTATNKDRAGVFVNAPVTEILDYAEKFRLTHIQLHGEELPADGLTLVRAGYKVIKTFAVSDHFDFSLTNSWLGVADYFLFDTRTNIPGGSGKKFDWEMLAHYRGEVPFFLSGGITGDDAEMITKITHPAFSGIDLNSGFEDGPGLKNKEKLEAFLKTILKI
jgi:phosphoribosylanthranilate isomerase